MVGAIDVGAPRNIGWAILSDGSEATGQDLDAFIDTFARLANDRPAALGFEAPLFIPVNAEGSDGLFDVFAALPGLRTERMLSQLRAGGAHPVVIWERRPMRPATRSLH